MPLVFGDKDALVQAHTRARRKFITDMPAPEQRTKEPKKREPLAEAELAWLKRLGNCTYLPGSPDKRFVRDNQGMTQMTIRQREYLHRLVYRYRRQLGMNDNTAKMQFDQLQALLPSHSDPKD